MAQRHLLINREVEDPWKHHNEERKEEGAPECQRHRNYLTRLSGGRDVAVADGREGHDGPPEGQEVGVEFAATRWDAEVWQFEYSNNISIHDNSAKEKVKHRHLRIWDYLRFDVEDNAGLEAIRLTQLLGVRIHVLAIAEYGVDQEIDPKEHEDEEVIAEQVHHRPIADLHRDVCVKERVRKQGEHHYLQDKDVSEQLLNRFEFLILL